MRSIRRRRAVAAAMPASAGPFAAGCGDDDEGVVDGEPVATVSAPDVDAPDVDAPDVDAPDLGDDTAPDGVSVGEAAVETDGTRRPPASLADAAGAARVRRLRPGHRGKKMPAEKELMW